VVARSQCLFQPSALIANVLIDRRSNVPGVHEQGDSFNVGYEMLIVQCTLPGVRAGESSLFSVAHYRVRQASYMFSHMVHALNELEQDLTPHFYAGNCRVVT
jgi:hypothetical protein